MKKRILLVEDDASLGRDLQDRLRLDYELTWVQTQKAATEYIQNKGADLFILDIGLPDGNGFEVAKLVKAHHPQSAFLFLTAQGDAETRLEGYELGAEEFIPKPFHLRELLLRVEHVLEKHISQMVLDLDQVQVDFQKLSVHGKDGKIDYPPVKDMQVLKFLVEKSPNPVSRDEIVNAIWGEDSDVSPRTVDNTLARIRQIMGDEGEKYIRSVRGVGYQWIGKNG